MITVTGGNYVNYYWYNSSNHLVGTYEIVTGLPAGVYHYLFLCFALFLKKC